jgi:hypothetical protein
VTVQRLFMPQTDVVESVLLEVFELGDGPIDSGRRHAVWMHHLKSGRYCWKCCCGAQRSHHEPDAALLANAREHFDQAWKPAAVPIWHPVAIWNDRAMKQAAPTTTDLEALAREIRQRARKLLKTTEGS